MADYAARLRAVQAAARSPYDAFAASVNMPKEKIVGMHTALLKKEAHLRSQTPEQRRAAAAAMDKVISDLPCDSEHLRLPGMDLQPVLSAPAPPEGGKRAEFPALDLKQVAAALTFDAAPFNAREAVRTGGPLDPEEAARRERKRLKREKKERKRALERDPSINDSGDAPVKRERGAEQASTASAGGVDAAPASKRARLGR